jgi:predicted metal-binding membrane protein
MGYPLQGLTPARIHRLLFPPVLGLLIIASWAVLLLWQQSPYARYLQHESWLPGGALGRICASVPGAPAILAALAHAAAWMLMTIAMMLPTSLPLILLFGRMIRARPNGSTLMGLLLAGYLAAWGLFGLAAHGLDLALHEIADRIGWIALNGWAMGAAIVAGAGAFQFSPLKYRCLDKCRAPFGFVAGRWRGRAERREAFHLGWAHGLFCVGCCWAIMLLMFVVGTGSIGWMLALAAIMAAEKNLPWGRALSKPLGAALLLWSAALLVPHLQK